MPKSQRPTVAGALLSQENFDTQMHHARTTLERDGCLSGARFLFLFYSGEVVPMHIETYPSVPDLRRMLAQLGEELRAKHGEIAEAMFISETVSATGTYADSNRSVLNPPTDRCRAIVVSARNADASRTKLIIQPFADSENSKSITWHEPESYESSGQTNAVFKGILDGVRRGCQNLS